jgi:hypothetical protein
MILPSASWGARARDKKMSEARGSRAMPEPMRFWELVSAFRNWPDVVHEVLATEPWRRVYLGLLARYNELVDRQDRDVLDAPVPFGLSREVAARCPQRFAYDAASRQLRCAGAGEPGAAGPVEMSALEVHERFGGSVIEEVFEKGSARIPRAF